MSRYLLLAISLSLASCDPKTARALIDALGPFACDALDTITHGNRTVAVACPAMLPILDTLLARKSADLGAGSCERHLVVVDGHGKRVAFACEPVAVALADEIRGSTVSP